MTLAKLPELATAEAKFYIYEITNKTTGKSYIGKTNNLKARLASHKHKANKGDESPLYRAIRKYGWDNFTYDVVLVCESDEKVQKLEFDWINLWEPHQLYNIRRDRIQGPRKDLGNRWSGKQALDIYPIDTFKLPYHLAFKEYGIPKTTFYRNRKIVDIT